MVEWVPVPIAQTGRASQWQLEVAFTSWLFGALDSVSIESQTVCVPSRQLCREGTVAFWISEGAQLEYCTLAVRESVRS